MAVYRSDQAQLTFSTEAVQGGYPELASSVTNGTGNSTLNGAHSAGSNSITVASSSGITADEHVVIGTSATAESEIRTVVFVDGNVLHLNAPLAFSHANSAAVQVVTATAATSADIYIDQIPGVYETVDCPDPEMAIEPRYFLGTGSKRNFYSAYKGQQAYNGSIPGFILLNGRALRYPFGKVVTEPSAKTDRTYLTTSTVKGDVFITVNSASSLTADTLVCIDYTDTPTATSVSEVRKIVSVSSTTLKLDYPLQFAHTTAGSGTTQITSVAASGVTYQHHIFETVDLDTVSWHVHFRDSGETAANDFDRRYYGGMIGSATISAEEGGLVSMSWDGVNFMGMVHNQIPSSGTVTPFGGLMKKVADSEVDFPTTDPYYFSEGNVTLFGQNIARVRSFNLTVSNGEEPRYYVQPRYGRRRGPSEIRENRREYGCMVTLALPDSQAADSTSNTLFRELLFEGDYTSGMQGFNISLTFTRGTNDSITITIPDDGTAAVGGNNQGAFIRTADHSITGDNPVQVDADILFRNMKIEVNDSLYYYP